MGAIVGAGVVIGACYFNSLAVPFLLDDAPTIVDNPSIRELGRLGDVLNPPAFAFSAGRPLLNLSFALNHAAGGLSVGGYHWVNLAIHLANAFLLWAVAARLLTKARVGERLGTSTELAAGCVALLWAIHPVQTVCVTYLSQRAESLMALFYLLTLYCFIRGIESARSAIWQAAAAIACCAGVLVKEVMITAPVACLLVDWCFYAGSWREALRLRGRTYGMLGVSWLGLAWLIFDTNLFWRLSGAKRMGVSLAYGVTQLRAVGEYVMLGVWPHPLVFDRGSSAAALEQYPLWRGVAILGAAGGATLWACRRMPRLGFLGLVFFLLLGPTSSVVPVWGQPIAENRLYLPLAALVAGLVLGALWLSRRWGLVAIAGCALGFGLLTVRRNGDFQSAERIWNDTVAKAPANHRARGSLGVSLLEVPGRQKEGLAHLEAARQMDGQDPETLFQLGGAYSAGRDTWPLAIERYQECLRLNPVHAMAQARLGALLAQSGRVPEAIQHLERAFTLRPDRVDFRVALGGVLATLPARVVEAIGLLEAAVRQAPGNAEAYLNLGNAHLATPHGLPQGVSAYETALQLNPQLAGAWYNLGGALARLPGREAEALVCYENVLRLAPDFRAAAERLEKLRSARPAVPAR